MYLLVPLGEAASPQPVSGVTMLEALVLFLCLLASLGGPILLFVFSLKRALAWMDRRGWVSYHSHVPIYGSLGNAFLEIQAIGQPEMAYILELREDEQEKRQDSDSGGRGPEAEPELDREADRARNRRREVGSL